MKTLVLMRHAKAEKPFGETPDFERTLTQRGENDATEMGKRLAKTGFKPNLILCSPAKRTLKTAKLVADELGYSRHAIETDAQLYEASVDDVMKAIRNIDNEHKRVLLVGHNPAFTSLIGYLSKSFVEHLPTAGIAIIEFEADIWQMALPYTGKLLRVDYPKREE